MSQGALSQGGEINGVSPSFDIMYIPIITQ
jgi:hypothetical protein